VEYYVGTCRSVGLNPLTHPLMFLKQRDGKVILYAKRDATDQLRKLHHASTQIVDRRREGNIYIVVARVTDRQGRSEESIGAVMVGGQQGEALANAMMKAETKAKRRATLSLAGLGMLDETETETIPGAQIEPLPEIPPDSVNTPGELEPPEEPDQTEELNEAIHAARTALGWDDDDVRDYVAEMYPESEPKALTTEQLQTMLDDLNRMVDMKQADQETQEEVAKS